MFRSVSIVLRGPQLQDREDKTHPDDSNEHVCPVRNGKVLNVLNASVSSLQIVPRQPGYRSELSK